MKNTKKWGQFIGLMILSLSQQSQAITYAVGSSMLGMRAEATTAMKGSTTAYTADAFGTLNFSLLKKNFIAAGSQITANIQNTGVSRITGYLKVAGKTVARIDRTFVTTASYTSPPVAVGIECPRFRVGIGPLALGVRFFANANAWAEATSAVNFNSNRNLPPTSRLTAGASGEVNIGGEVDLSLVFVSGGVRGNVRVAKHSLNCSLTVDFAKKTGNAALIWSRWAPSGTIEGWVRIKLLFISKTWSKSILEWNGTQSDAVLASKSFNLSFKKSAVLVPTEVPLFSRQFIRY